MRRRAVIVGIPSVFVVSAPITNGAKAQSTNFGTQAVSAARESLVGFQRDFLTEASKVPLTQVQDPLRTAPSLIAADFRIRADLQAALADLKNEDLLRLVLPSYIETAAQLSKFGSLAPTKDEIVPVRAQPPIRRGSLWRKIQKIIETIAKAVDIADLIVDFINFVERNWKLSRLADDIERARIAKDLLALVRAIEAFLDEMFTTSFAQFFGFVPNPYHVRLARRIVTRYVPYLNVALLAIEIANDLLTVADEVFDV